jgi:AraC-like DNA-binding protein
VVNFREAVGLTPKLYCRVLRFQRALRQLAEHPRIAWIDTALNAGYSDQAHFNRDFRELAGLTPGQYRALAPISANHVPLRA